MPSKAWVLLIIAIIFEVSGTTSMKLSEGLTRLWPSVFIFFFYGVSFALLTLCLKHMEVSIAYAVWSGLGTFLIAIIGMAYFKEPVSATKAVSLALIIIGVVGVNLTGTAH